MSMFNPDELSDRRAFTGDRLRRIAEKREQPNATASYQHGRGARAEVEALERKPYAEEWLFDTVQDYISVKRKRARTYVGLLAIGT
jgi:hypothetical protein